MSDDWGMLIATVILFPFAVAFPTAVLLIGGLIVLAVIPEAINWVKKNTSNEKPWLDKEPKP